MQLEIIACTFSSTDQIVIRYELFKFTYIINRIYRTYKPACSVVPKVKTLVCSVFPVAKLDSTGLKDLLSPSLVFQPEPTVLDF